MMGGIIERRCAGGGGGSCRGGQLHERTVEPWLTRRRAKHGHRGLHVRDAARRCALGVHLEGGRGGDLQTLPGVTGRWPVGAFICPIKP